MPAIMPRFTRTLACATGIALLAGASAVAEAMADKLRNAEGIMNQGATTVPVSAAKAASRKDAKTPR